MTSNYSGPSFHPPVPLSISLSVGRAAGEEGVDDDDDDKDMRSLSGTLTGDTIVVVTIFFAVPPLLISTVIA